MTRAAGSRPPFPPEEIDLASTAETDDQTPRVLAPPAPAGLSYAFPEAPAPARLITVAPGVHWLRMPLPFALDHINLWLVEDGAPDASGWTLIDTGICRDEVKALWRRLVAGPMTGRSVRRVIATHFHPDHVGLAGWLAAEHHVPLWMTRGEWLMTALLQRDVEGVAAAEQVAFYRRNGLSEDWAAPLAERGNTYRRRIAPPPAGFHRIVDGEEIAIGDERWTVIVGTGHAPEHACLYCARLGVLISGDQILPKITPNVSLFAGEPDSDPLGDFLRSLDRFRGLPEDTLVLPSHGFPFRGLGARLDAMAEHHEARLLEIIEACDTPRTAAEMIPLLFRRTLDVHQIMFAMGESLAHLAHLAAAGRLARVIGADGLVRYRRPA